MPIIEFYSPQMKPPVNLFEQIAAEVRETLDLPADHVWLLWHKIDIDCYYRENWQTSKIPAPIVKIRCKSVYSDERVKKVIHVIAENLSFALKIPQDVIYILVDPVQKGHLFVRGKIWE